jgi:hypothetical protein
MNNAWSVGAVALSVLVVGGYELLEWRAAAKDPRATARSAHSLLRGEWVRALSQQPGTELLAVQALRNSLMSATITASTAVLVLLSVISVLASRGDDARVFGLSVGRVLELGLGTALFAAYVCSAMAMRYYHHTGFVMSLPVGTPERSERESFAATYLQRAGVLYSWSLRCFFFAATIATGLMQPLVMPVAAIALVFVLSFFDRAPRV